MTLEDELRALMEAASVFRSCVRPVDLVARLFATGGAARITDASNALAPTFSGSLAELLETVTAVAVGF